MSKNQDLGELINGIKSLATNQLNAPAYTSAAAFTGTIAGYLGFDSSGNILTATGSSQWITSGSNIYYNTGSVGIGTATPSVQFHVFGSSAQARVTNTTASSGAFFVSLNDVGANCTIGMTGTSNSVASNSMLITTGGGQPIIFAINDVEKIRIAINGNFGIGTSSPSFKLSVINEMQVGAQGGSDYTYISGGSGYGSVIRNFFATGSINNELKGNGNNYFNSVTGNFGIGESNPSFKLVVNGDVLIKGGGDLRIAPAAGTTDSVIYNDYDDLRFVTQGSQKMIILASGRVGIGLDNPAYKLDVVGDVNITGSFRVNGTPIGTGGGGVSGSGSTNFLAKWSAGTALTNSQIFDNGSSIGFKTSSPFYGIDYALTGSLRLGYFIGSIDGTDNASGIVAHNGNGISQTVPFGLAASKFAWYIGTSEAMRIDTNRNLLINTTGGVTGAGAVQVNGDVNVTGTFRVNGVQYSTGGGGGGISGSGNTNYVPKFTGSTSIGDSAMWDNGNFSVHLGMTSFSGTGGDPQRYIAIYGPESSGIIFKGDTSDSQATSFIKRTNGVGNLALFDTREIYMQVSSSNYFKMNGSGVGINVQPFGTPYILTLPNSSTQVAVAFSWLTYSDGRVKKDIQEIEYGINEVMKMKPVKYKHYSSVFENNILNIGDQYTNEIGFVAQDIHKIINEAVNCGSEKELWSLDKSKLIPVLVKAIQELKSELDIIKSNIA